MTSSSEHNGSNNTSEMVSNNVQLLSYSTGVQF